MKLRRGELTRAVVDAESRAQTKRALNLGLIQLYSNGRRAEESSSRRASAKSPASGVQNATGTRCLVITRRPVERGRSGS